MKKTNELGETMHICPNDGRELNTRVVGFVVHNATGDVSQRHLNEEHLRQSKVEGNSQNIIRCCPECSYCE
jgi:hypothetical protein